MIASLRQHQFDTVLGPSDFDEKGDLTVTRYGTSGGAAPTCRWSQAPETRAHPASAPSPSPLTRNARSVARGQRRYSLGICFDPAIASSTGGKGMRPGNSL